MILDRVAVVGAGRVGLTLARALRHSGSDVVVLGRQPRALPEPLPPVETDWAAAVARSDLLLLTVPDDAIAAVAGILVRIGAISNKHVVLHTSGLHDRSALAPLDGSGAALGSWHPLQTFALPGGDPGALAGSPVAIEGDARALEAGRILATRLHLRPVVELAAAAKPAYHAAAVFASNYVQVLAAIAARLARDAGAGHASPQLFLPLMRRSLANLAAGGSASLTGPISRGDAGTVARHLAALHGSERALYVGLGREALRLARDAGLDGEKARAIEGLLTG